MKFFQRVVYTSLFPLLFALFCPTESHAWARDGTPVAIGPQSQVQPKVVGADDGGAFVVWTDQGTHPGSGSDYVVLAQKLGPGGASEWEESGVRVGFTAGAQSLAQLASDDQGGVIVAWSQFDASGSNAAVYAQRFTAKGQRLWGDQGVRLAPLEASTDFALVGDGAGGAFTVGDTLVRDDSLSGYDRRLLLQHAGDRGQLLWPAGALRVSEGRGSQFEPKAVPDGHGGVIVAWIDGRDLFPGGFNADVYAQRFTGDGSRLWLSTGAPVCLNKAPQWSLAVIARPSGGIDLAWADTRKYPLFQYQVYAQALDENGEPRWTQDGVLVSPYGEQGAAALADDGADGIIVAWNEFQAPSYAIHIFAQHLDASGSALWQVGGITLSQPRGGSSIVSDGEGGAIVLLSGEQAVIQHVSGEGALLQSEVLSPSADGYGALTSTKNQFIAVWGDVRNGPDDIDVYAARFKPSPSHVPPSLTIRESETPQTRTGDLSLTVSPNPASGRFTVSAATTGGLPARLSVFDIHGRLVMGLDLSAGAMSMTAGARDRLEPGIYLVVVEQGKTKAVQRICLLP